MKVLFHPKAREELLESAKYYEKCQKGLGKEFIREIHLAIERIKAYPAAWSKFSKNTRRCLVNRFPYGIIYQYSESRIYILAVMHLNRRPEYWTERIKR